MIKRLSSDIFQVGALSIAKIHLNTGAELNQTAETLWKEYGRGYDDPVALTDWIRAAASIVSYLRDEKHHEHAAAVTHHAQFYCKYYDDKGNKRLHGASGLFRVLFSPSRMREETVARESPGDRVAVLIKKFKGYQISLDAGLDVPEAPDGWSI